MIFFEGDWRVKPSIATGRLRVIAIVSVALLVGSAQAQVSLAELARDVAAADKGVAMSQKAPSDDSRTPNSLGGPGVSPDVNTWEQAAATNELKTPQSQASQRSEGLEGGSSTTPLQPVTRLGTDSLQDRPSAAEYRQGVQYMSGLNFVAEDPERAAVRREIAIGMVAVGGLVLLGFGLRRAFFRPRTYH